jgi:hypothetical protein
MSIDYAELAVVATGLIKEAGMTMTLVSTDGADVYDPVTDVTTPAGPGAETPFMGVLLNIDSKYAQKVGTENIQLRDMLVYMEPSVVAPKMEDSIRIDGETMDIVNVERVAPAGIAVLYILQVRP